MAFFDDQKFLKVWRNEPLIKLTDFKKRAPREPGSYSLMMYDRFYLENNPGMPNIIYTGECDDTRDRLNHYYKLIRDSALGPRPIDPELVMVRILTLPNEPWTRKAIEQFLIMNYNPLWNSSGAGNNTGHDRRALFDIFHPEARKKWRGRKVLQEEVEQAIIILQNHITLCTPKELNIPGSIEELMEYLRNHC